MKNSSFQIFRKLPDGCGQLFEYEHSDPVAIGAKLKELVVADDQAVFNVYDGGDQPSLTFQGHWGGNPALAR